MASKLPSPLDVETLEPASPSTVIRPSTLVTLIIARHPELGRVGQRAVPSLLGGGRAVLSRAEPSFLDADGRTHGPLQDPHVSRAPIHLSLRGDELVLDLREARGVVRLGGRVVSDSVVLDAATASRGALLGLADSVLLFVARRAWGPRASQRHGLVGVGEVAEAVRRAVDVAAGHDDPVLLAGESGTGKEVVASAIHRASPRSSGPFVAINMAALNPSTAAAELFGHTRGAFTGADDAHFGHFGRADRGTLLLDEIGDTPVSVQPMLLRALETGAIEPVGGRGSRAVDVRVIAATDRDLSDDSRFRLPLLHRLATQRIALPPLRERSEDVMPLLLHFLALEADAPAAELVSFELASTLLAHRWPGNVRELRNVAKALRREGPGVLATLLEPASSALHADEPPGSARANPATLSDAQVLEALRRNGFAAGATARELGIARNTLYRRMAQQTLRRGRDIDAIEIEASLAACGGDLDEAAGVLGVSRRALALRMRELGLEVRG